MNGIYVNIMAVFIWCYTGDLEENIIFDYQWMIKNIDLETIENGCYSSYAEALYNWIDSVISNDIRDLRRVE